MAQTSPDRWMRAVAATKCMPLTVDQRSYGGRNLLRCQQADKQQSSAINTQKDYKKSLNYWCKILVEEIWLCDKSVKCFCLLINFDMLSIDGGDYKCHKSSREGERGEIVW